MKSGGKESIDLAFVDTDKISYTEYLEYYLQLIRPDGLILVGNVLWGCQVAKVSNQDKEIEALRVFYLEPSDDQRVGLCMVPTEYGLTIA